MATVPKRVLMVAYDVPPLGSIAAKRVAKFAKYLCREGWEPVLLTVRNPVGHRLDPETIEDIQGVEVIRTPRLELPPSLYHRGVRLRAQAGSAARSGLTGRAWSLLYCVARAAMALVFVPDFKVGWLPFLVGQGMRVARARRVDAIWATGPPFSVLVGAMILKRVCRVPYVADFRDEWTTTGLFRAEKPRPVQMVERWLEGFVVRSADRVVVTTEPMAEFFRRRYPRADDSRFVAIYNGYDAADMEALAGVSPITDRFVISHVGTVTPNRDLTPFLEALAGLAEEDASFRRRVLFQVVGDVLVDGIATYRARLGDVLDEAGAVSHREAIRRMGESHVLLAVENATEEGARHLPAKVFEYLAAGRPILVLGSPRGATARIIDEHGAGVVVHPEDAGGIRDAIRRFYNQWVDDPAAFTSSRPYRVDGMTREARARELAVLLNQVAAVPMNYADREG